MGKFVDADKLMDSLTRKKSSVANQRYTEGFNDALMRFRSMLHSAPAADVVEVVRCEKCQHRDKNGLCQAEGQKLTIAKDNHFCSKGERRSENEG